MGEIVSKIGDMIVGAALESEEGKKLANNAFRKLESPETKEFLKNNKKGIIGVGILALGCYAFVKWGWPYLQKKWLQNNSSNNKIREYREKVIEDIKKDKEETDQKIRLDDARTANKIKLANNLSKNKKSEWAFKAELKAKTSADKASQQQSPQLTAEAEQQLIARALEPHRLNEQEQAQEIVSSQNINLMGFVKIHPCEIIVIGAEAKTGKSTLATGLSLEYKSKRPQSGVLLFDTEFKNERNQHRYGGRVKEGYLSTHDCRGLNAEQLTKVIRKTIATETAGVNDVLVTIDNITGIAKTPHLFNELKKLQVELEAKGVDLQAMLVAHPKANQRTPKNFGLKDLDCHSDFTNFADAVYVMLVDPKDENKRLFTRLRAKDDPTETISLQFEEHPYLHLVPQAETEPETAKTKAPADKRPVGRPASPNRDELIKQAVALRKQGLTQQQIGERLECSQRKVSKLLHCAKKQAKTAQPPTCQQSMHPPDMRTAA